MNSKQKYIDLCLSDSCSSIAIFSQYWWLDAVVGENNWDVALVEKDNKIVASLPYVIKHKYGLTILGQPPLTQTLGPWLRDQPANTKYTRLLENQKDLMSDLINQLPHHDFFLQNFSPEITNWLPWYWQGFYQTTAYTYRLKNLHDVNAIWEGLRENIRRDIRKARKRNIIIDNNATVEEFLPLQRQTFERQGKVSPISEDMIRRLDTACAKSSARRIFIAKDAEGQSHAGIYLVWNNHAAYYLMGGGNPNLRNSGATSLAMWEAIQFASTVSKVFDFEGSMIEPVERFFRGFGAHQTPYFKVSRYSNRWLNIANHFREIIRLLLVTNSV